MLREHNELELDTLFRLCHNLNINDKRIAFTHGAFDLFHYGHLSLLRETKKICDFLIVGIESDVNVIKYKSIKRPIINEQRRLEIVSELHCVNAAFINRNDMTDDWYLELYKNFKADLVTVGINFGYKNLMLERMARTKTKFEVLNTEYDSTTTIIESIIHRYVSSTN
jgi:cytidyltransferase-like protein